MIRKLAAACLALLAALGASLVLAQNYPTKPVRILIAQAPGSATDVISRIVGNKLSEAIGQPVIIEARPGAGGMLGTEAAARSAPDGYTLFMANNSTHGSNPAVYAKLPYDPVKDFAPISFVASVPYVLVVQPSMPVNSVRDLIEYVKARPGKVNYASAGNGSTHQFCAELLKSTAGIDMIHVPYKGSPPGVLAVTAGEVSVMFANLTDIGGQLKGGKLKPLAVTTAQRSSHVPDLPTMEEAGVPGFEIVSWFAILAPAGVPTPIVTRLNTEINKVIARDDVRSTLGAQGLDTQQMSTDQLAAHIRSEIAKFAKIAKAANIKAE
jgi:tripartite-type tricarboxylate transporter receptor subunit TctC